MSGRRLKIILLGIAVLIVALLVIAAWPGRSHFTVSRETTYVTEPLDDEGYVDYVTALNIRLRGDIKPEDNANVLIWKALGSHPEGGTMPDEYFQWLGIDRPPEDGEYLTNWWDLLRKNKALEEKIQRSEALDPMDWTCRWPWKAQEEPELAEFLRSNEKPLAVIIEATFRKQFYNPLIPHRDKEWSLGLDQAFDLNVQACRAVAVMLASQAMLELREGKPDAAWQKLLACHRLGRLIARGGTTIELLVGIAIDQIAGRADLVFLDHAKMNSAQIMTCQTDLLHLRSMPPFADKVDLGGRFTELDRIMRMARIGTASLEDLPDTKEAYRKFPKSRWFRPSINYDPQLRKTNYWYDRFADAFGQPDRVKRLSELRLIENEIDKLNRSNPSPGFFQKSFFRSVDLDQVTVLAGLLMVSDIRVYLATERCEQTLDNLTVAFAITAYKSDNARYPAKLEDLVPKYLPKVPDDLFSGKPLIYRLENNGYLLYSVGVNGVDDGGHGYDDDPKGDDLVVRVPTSKPSLKKKDD